MEKYIKQLTQKELGKMISIAKAAAKLFNEKGYLETSMDDISTAAKLSKGDLFHHPFLQPSSQRGLSGNPFEDRPNEFFIP